MSRASVSAVIALAATSAAAAPPVQAQEAPDRYGAPAGPPAGSPLAAPAGYALPRAAAGTPLRGRMLSWPGKLDTLAAAPPSYAGPRETPGDGGPFARWNSAGPAGARAYAPAACAPVAYSQAAQAYGYARPPARRPARYVPAPDRGAAADRDAPPAAMTASDGWRPVFGGAPSRLPATSRPAELAGAPVGSPPLRSALPTSIYAPAPVAAQAPAPDAGWSPGARAAAAPPPLRSASAAQRYGYDPTQDHGVRFYSVHRPFGLQPDPAPIPPQFFTATADLADPPGPLPTDHSITTSTGTTHTSRVASDAGAN